MKGPLKFLGILLAMAAIIGNIIEMLAIPALFTVIGLLNSFSWKYYAVTIGGYFIIAITIQVIFHFAFKKAEKKYTSFLDKLFTKRDSDCK